MRAPLRRQLGASLVEVLVAIALTGLVLPTLAVAILTSSAARPAAEQRVQALSLEREALEAVRVAREASWTNVATSGTYHPARSGNTWGLVSGSETIGSLTRQIVIFDVQRNAGGQIVSGGGTVDASTKYVTVAISWTKPYPGSVSTNTYLSRWRSEASWTQTSVSDFSAGTLGNTVVTNNSGGEVELGNGNSSVTWATPIQAGSYNLSGTTNAPGVYVDGSTNRAYILNGSGMNIIDVTNPASPSLLGTFASSNVLNGVYVSGNYAYLASANNTGELTIVNVSNPASPAQAGILNLGDTADATSVFVSGSYAYIGKVFSSAGGSAEFYIVNVTNPASPTVAGSLDLTATVNAVSVSGNYAYLATAVTTAELTVVNVANKSTPTFAGTYNSAGTVAATDVFAGQTYVYLTELSNGSGPEFLILNASNPASISLVGSYEAGANVSSVYVVGTEAFLATAIKKGQFTVLDISTPSTPVVEGSVSQSTNNSVFVVNNIAYLASTNTSAELIIMQGSTVVGGKNATGTYTSPTFDAGAAAGFNYLAFSTLQPSGTSVTIQIATNNDNATWNYVGPDGTAFSQYATSSAIPLNKINGRYFRYLATLNTSSKNVTPDLLDVALTYSP